MKVTPSERIYKALEREPLYEGLVAYIGGCSDREARRILRRMADRGEASRNREGTWRLTP